MGILSVAHLICGQRNILWFEAFFCCFQAMKGPLGSRMVLNVQTSVPWEVEMKYFTMGWFHYGNTDRYWLERWTKGYLMIWGIFLAVFRQWRAPPGSWMVLNGQTSVPWEVEIKYFTMGWFHYGNTERYSLKRWQRDIWWFEAFCLPFSGTEGLP